MSKENAIQKFREKWATLESDDDGGDMVLGDRLVKLDDVLAEMEADLSTALSEERKRVIEEVKACVPEGRTEKALLGTPGVSDANHDAGYNMCREQTLTNLEALK